MAGKCLPLGLCEETVKESHLILAPCVTENNSHMYVLHEEGTFPTGYDQDWNNMVIADGLMVNRCMGIVFSSILTLLLLDKMTEDRKVMLNLDVI